MKTDIEKYNLSTDDVSVLIDKWIFNKRDREILKRRLIDGITFERLAEEFDLSVTTVKKIVYKSFDRLVAHL